MQKITVHGSVLSGVTALCAVFLLILFAQPALAQEDGMGEGETGAVTSGADLPADYQTCGECHLDYHAAWETGVHAIAYDRASFQDAWAQEENDPECLACHTTDFRPALGEYWQANINCEACHGFTPENHPPEELVVSTSAETCGDCHNSTFDEWEHSMHAFTADMGAVGCATCHNPHGQTIREPGDVGDNANGENVASAGPIDAMCLNCHQDDTATYVHLSHIEVSLDSVEVTCASCHMYQREEDKLHKLADHTMSVGTAACTDCHQTISLTGESPILIDIDSALAEERNTLLEQVEELQGEILTLEEEQDQSDDTYIRLTQGLIIGLGLGITLVIALRRGNGGEQSGSEA